MIRTLLDGNRRFVTEVFAKDQEHFADLTRAQNPTVLWIGCSDSRVPVNTITQTKAGEVFVHRNVANIVATNDWNLSAVLEFSINHLRIPDIVVCGHYGCGGIHALDEDHGDDRYIPIWLINAQKAATRVDRRLEAGLGEVDPEVRHRLIVDENVRLQLEHLQEYPFVAAALKAKRLRLHGWVYDMASGAIRIVSSPDEAD
jgi:carbonic anhydrase